MQKSLKDKLDELEKRYLVHRAVLERFPDALLNSKGRFRSKMVNQEYNRYEFWPKPNSLSLSLRLFHKMDIDANGTIAHVRVWSDEPAHYQLVQVDTFNTICFSNYMASFQKYHVRPDVIGPCQTAIADHIVKYQDTHEIDYTKLDPRIKELLVFM